MEGQRRAIGLQAGRAGDDDGTSIAPQSPWDGRSGALPRCCLSSPLPSPLPLPSHTFAAGGAAESALCRSLLLSHSLVSKHHCQQRRPLSTKQAWCQRNKGAVSGCRTATRELDQVQETTVRSCAAGGALQRAYERSSFFVVLFLTYRGFNAHTEGSGDAALHLSLISADRS